MALTLPRWIAAFVAGCLLIIPVTLATHVGPKPRSTERTELVQALHAASTDAARMASTVRLLQVRDSIAGATMSPIPIVPGLSIAFDHALEGPVLTALFALAQRSHELSVPKVVKTPTMVVFVLDTVQVIRGVQRTSDDWMSLDYILPSGSGAPCTVLARLRTSGVGVRGDPSSRLLTWLNRDAQSERFLGPCALYAAFGLPGEHVASWMQTGGWSLAGFNAWGRSYVELQQTSRRIRENRRLMGQGWSSSDATFIGDRLSDFSSLRRLLSPTAVQCLASILSACTQNLLDPDPSQMQTKMVGIHLVSPPRRIYSDFSYGQGFGSDQGRLMSDFIHQIGQEPFGRAWRSDLPVVEAFRTEAKVSIDSAAMDWLQQYYGKQQVGPVMQSAALVNGGLCLALGLIVTLGAARLRHTT